MLVENKIREIYKYRISVPKEVMFISQTENKAKYQDPWTHEVW